MEERARSTRRSERLHEDTNRASQRGDNLSCLLLSSMQLMSAAICVQICTHLHPRDLLSVSRLNKAFHAFLLQKSSANLWERAMDIAVELPPCPSRFIEPAWLSLLYSPSCTVGGKLHSEHCHISGLWTMSSELRNGKKSVSSLLDFPSTILCNVQGKGVSLTFVFRSINTHISLSLASKICTCVKTQSLPGRKPIQRFRSARGCAQTCPFPTVSFHVIRHFSQPSSTFVIIVFIRKHTSQGSRRPVTSNHKFWRFSTRGGRYPKENV